jgi:ArsR family transcriptional regulator, arsenate/arsenite/antimonite-responsive transcriptional repressor
MKSKQAIDALGALAQETRLAIFRLLVRQGPDGLPAGAIAERLEIPAPTMSFHLAYLSRAGLVTSRREGRSIVYAADYRGMNALLTYLTEDCCQGRPEICRPGFAVCGPATEALTDRTGDPNEAPARVRRR